MDLFVLSTVCIYAKFSPSGVLSQRAIKAINLLARFKFCMFLISSGLQQSDFTMQLKKSVKKSPTSSLYFNGILAQNGMFKWDSLPSQVYQREDKLIPSLAAF